MGTEGGRVVVAVSWHDCAARGKLYSLLLCSLSCMQALESDPQQQASGRQQAAASAAKPAAGRQGGRQAGQLPGKRAVPTRKKSQA
jgi:hypothetical protein